MLSSETLGDYIPIYKASYTSVRTSNRGVCLCLLNTCWSLTVNLVAEVFYRMRLSVAKMVIAPMVNEWSSSLTEWLWQGRTEVVGEKSRLSANFSTASFTWTGAYRTRSSQYRTPTIRVTLWGASSPPQIFFTTDLKGENKNWGEIGGRGACTVGLVQTNLAPLYKLNLS